MPLQQASWLAGLPEYARHSWPGLALRISGAGAAGAGGDSVLRLQPGTGHSGTSKSEVAAKLASGGTSSLNQGHVWDPDSRAGRGYSRNAATCSMSRGEEGPGV